MYRRAPSLAKQKLWVFGAIVVLAAKRRAVCGTSIGESAPLKLSGDHFVALHLCAVRFGKFPKLPHLGTRDLCLESLSS